MSGQACIIAIDIGTTSVKAVAVDASGKAIAAEEHGYPLLAPQPGWAEQDPEVIAAAVLQAASSTIRIAREQGSIPEAIAFSSAMHSLLAVDEAGRSLSHCIVWADLRSQAQAEQLRLSSEALSLSARTGIPIHAMTPLCKLMWLREHEPELLDRAACFIGIKEYVLAQWFDGSYRMDESIAGGTGLYNVHTRDWDEEAMRLAGICREKLPRIVPSTDVWSGMQSEIADALGVARGIPVVVGAADGVLANLGTGAIEPGVAAITIGTSGALRMAVRKPLEGPSAGKLFCYPLASTCWIAGGPVNSGGIILQWLRDELMPDWRDTALGRDEDPYKALVEAALAIAPGAEGLLCLPYLGGERAPYWDEQARGTFVGLSFGHGRAHMVRACLEGMLLGLRTIAAELESAAGAIREVRASGGLVRSPAICQLMADVLGVPVSLPDTGEGSAIGAAMLAGQALGRTEQLGWTVAAKITYWPDPEAALLYSELHLHYKTLYGQLADTYKALAKFRHHPTQD